MIVCEDGLHWLVSDRLSGDRIGPDHEKPLRDRVLALIPEGGTFIDVGAHVGCYSIRAAHIASIVHAIEPNQDAVDILLANCRVNLIDNVHVHRAAAWNCTTGLKLVSPNGFPRDASMRTLESLEGTVLGMPLDDMLPDLQRADLVKIDVEGSDLHALEGMRKLTARLSPKLIIEDHSVLGYFSPEALQDKITSLGYASEHFGTYGGANYWLCTRRDQS